MFTELTQRCVEYTLNNLIYFYMPLFTDERIMHYSLAIICTVAKVTINIRMLSSQYMSAMTQ